MCLVLVAWQKHARYRLIIAANRDEQHARPAAAMQWWPDQPQVLAGRDLQAGGTWLALSRSGRFATVTNYREHKHTRPARLSRGKLVSDFVTGDAAPLAYSEKLDGANFAGFSLLTATATSLCYTTNRDDPARTLDAGTYGLSNATLDTPWPKLLRCRGGLDELIERDAVNPTTLLALLADTTPAAVKDFDENLPIELARAVSAPFIKTETYGTRCTTIVLVEHSGDSLVIERRFNAHGQVTGDNEFRFKAPA